MSSTTTSKTLFGNCPACGGLLKVAATTRPNDSIECPHCNHHFALLEMDDLTVPESKVVRKSEPTSKTEIANMADSGEIPLVDRVLYESQDGGSKKRYQVPPQLAKGAKQSRGRSSKREARFRAVSDSSSEFLDLQPPNLAMPDSSAGSAIDRSSDHQSNPPAGPRIQQSRSAPGMTAATASAVRRRQSTQRSSHRRRTSSNSTWAEGFKIVAGGIVAMPLAYLILMWFLSQDPLTLGPTISQYAPTFVPEKFRQAGEENQVESTPVIPPVEMPEFHDSSEEDLL